MPEPPDFEQIARGLFAQVQDAWTTQQIDAEVTLIAEQLRQVWNARGAADLAAVDDTMKYYLYGSDASIVTTLASTLKHLDR